MSIKNNTVHKVLPKVVVTGANGFVGKGLVHALLESSKYEVFSVVRKIPSDDAHPRNNYALIDNGLINNYGYNTMMKIGRVIRYSNLDNGFVPINILIIVIIVLVLGILI